MRLRHVLIATALLMAGCYRAVGVAVTELPGGQLSIAASESWNPIRPCVRYVWIRRQEGGRWSDYWIVSLKDGEAQCLGELTYPLVPPGYELTVAPTSNDHLRSGDVLEVEIGGDGFGATSTLTVS